jgi:adenylate cyclase class 2
MGRNQEIEIKFRIKNPRKLLASLRSAGFKRITPRTHEMNTLYDLPGQALRTRGEILRLRHYGKKWVLTHKSKGKAGVHKTRTELETTLEDGNQMDTILRALGYQPSFRYEKFRSEWSDSKGHVVVDETPIGQFGEIEGSPRWIDAAAKRLGLSKQDYLTDTYAGLFFAWKESTASAATEMTFRAIESPSTHRKAPN